MSLLFRIGFKKLEIQPGGRLDIYLSITDSIINNKYLKKSGLLKASI